MKKLLIIILCFYSSSNFAKNNQEFENKASFLTHPTHCSQLVGGDDFKDNVSAEYSKAISTVLDEANNEANIKKTLDDLKTSCLYSLNPSGTPNR